MFILMMAKILTNLSLYYALISLFRGNGSLLPVILSIGCCMAGVGLWAWVAETAKIPANASGGAEAAAARMPLGNSGTVATSRESGLKKILIKAAGILLLLLPFLLPLVQGRIGTGIMCLIPSAYCITLIFMGNLRVNYNRFETHLRISALVFLLFLALSAFFSSSWPTAAFFTVLYLYTGTWLLRQLRLQEGSDARVRILDALISAGILLAVYIAGGLLLFALGYAGNFLSVLIVPIEAILYVLAWIFYTLMSLLPIGGVEIPDSQFMGESVAAEEVTMENSVSHSGDFLKIVLIIAVAYFVIKLLIRLIVKFKDREIPEFTDEKEIRREKITRPHKSRQIFTRDSQNTVRKLYRRYLKRLKADGLKLQPGTTSEDVCKTAKAIHERKPIESAQSEAMQERTKTECARAGTIREKATIDGARAGASQEAVPSDINQDGVIYDAENAGYPLPSDETEETPDVLIRRIYMQVRYKPGYEPTDKQLQDMKNNVRKSGTS